jgi:hypothetical protein
MSTNQDVSRFSIYQQRAPDKKHHEEACAILHLLWRLDSFMKLDDVQVGQDPPDFVFHYQGREIGVELTDLNPKTFGTGGHRLRGEFDKWQKQIEPDSLPHEHEWGSFSLRESLAAFQGALNSKRKDANRWCDGFPERWLLMRIAAGSPFREIIAGEHDMKVEAEPGMEDDFADFRAKAIHSIYSICQDIRPFDYVLLFRKTNLASSVCNLVTFPANPANPHLLPGPSDETLKRGASVSDCFLDRKPQRTTIITVRSRGLGGRNAH